MSQACLTIAMQLLCSRGEGVDQGVGVGRLKLVKWLLKNYS